MPTGRGDAAVTSSHVALSGQGLKMLRCKIDTCWFLFVIPTYACYCVSLLLLHMKILSFWTVKPNGRNPLDQDRGLRPHVPQKNFSCLHCPIIRI